MIKFNVYGRLPSLVSDPTSLGCILTELLNNACKYTPPTEIITLKASTESDKLRSIVSNTKSGLSTPFLRKQGEQGKQRELLGAGGEQSLSLKGGL